jgi:hypothetical protein
MLDLLATLALLFFTVAVFYEERIAPMVHGAGMIWSSLTFLTDLAIYLLTSFYSLFLLVVSFLFYIEFFESLSNRRLRAVFITWLIIGFNLLMKLTYGLVSLNHLLWHVSLFLLSAWCLLLIFVTKEMAFDLVAVVALSALLGAFCGGLFYYDESLVFYLWMLILDVATSLFGVSCLVH